MKRTIGFSLAAALVLLSISSFVAAKDITINVWDQQDVQQEVVFDRVVSNFMSENPGIIVVRTHYGTEDLRSQFQNTAIAGKGPELVWGPPDNIGPFSAAELIMPLDSLLGDDFFKKFSAPSVNSIKLGGKIYGVPITMGNTLTLLYNKKLIATPPKKWSEIIAFAKKFNDGTKFAIVYNEAEAFWFVTFLGGYGGSVFASGTAEPTLDTPAMAKALQFVQDLKFKEKILPEKTDYNVADGLFKDGKAAMLINGPWSFQGYKDILGDSLGITELPVIDDSGKPMLAYSSPKAVCVNANVKDPDTLNAIKKFLAFLTDKEFEVAFSLSLKESPAVSAFASDPSIKADPFIAAVVNQVNNSVPMPIVPEMRAIWDSMGPELIKIMANQEKPEDAAKAMQDNAVKKIKEMK